MTQLLDPAKQSTAEQHTASSAKIKPFDPTRRYATLTFMRGAVVSITITLLAGLLGSLYYIPALAPTMRSLGISFTTLRPIHTTFAVAFIFLAGLAVVHRYLEDVAGPMKAPEKLRLKVHLVSWAIAGIGILVSYALGVYSGREYMGFHPIFSIPIMLGWIMFAINFFSHTCKGLLAQPIHVSMWSVGILFFMYTFAEQHAWLLPTIASDPLIDMRIQWKATGTLVGSFNLFVYGALYYTACKVTGSETYAHSRLAYALLVVGLLNSFTNFAHHTYHLPQSHLVKWISFVVSMAEIIILARVVWDIAAMVKATKSTPACGIQLFLAATKWWTGFILVTAILISIPPLNALIHGTRLVMGHAMGAEIGIDAMALFAALTLLLIELRQRKKQAPTTLVSKQYRRWIVGFNIGVVALVGWLTLSGLITAIHRYDGLATPQWVTSAGPIISAVSGFVAAYYLMRLITTWLTELFPRQSKP